MSIIFGIQNKQAKFRPLLGKWSEFRPAQENQTRVATVTIEIRLKIHKKTKLDLLERNSD